MATLKGAIYRYKPGMDAALMTLLEGVKDELVTVRKMLVGGDKS